jgi:methyl-accepting chemotaxis protein
MRIRLGATFGVIVLLVAIMMTLALDAMPDSSPRGWIWGLGAAVLAFSVICWFRLTGAIEVPLREAEFIAETVAAGDLSKEFETDRGGDFGRLLGGLGEMEDMLTDLVTRIKSASDSISSASQQIAVGNTDLSQRTEEQAATLQETASSMSELTTMVRQNTDRARTANGLATSASGIAERGGELVGKVVKTMDAISASSRKVTDIIAVIEGIAFQTNILALNAAKEINVLIHDSAHQVESGSALVGQAGATMDEIVQAVRRVTQILGEIAVASEHQSAGIEQVNVAVTQMDDVTQQNAALVEQAAAASSALADQAQELQKVVGEFKL